MAKKKRISLNEDGYFHEIVEGIITQPTSKGKGPTWDRGGAAGAGPRLQISHV